MDYKMDGSIEMEPYPKTRKAWTKEEDEILLQSIQAVARANWHPTHDEAVPESMDEYSGSERKQAGVDS